MSANPETIVLNVARREKPKSREASMGSVFIVGILIDQSDIISEPEGSIQAEYPENTNQKVDKNTSIIVREIFCSILW